MLSIPNSLAPFLQNIPESLLLVSLLVVSLLLVFAGGTVVKVIAFLIVGVAGAVVGASLGAQYLPTAAGNLIGALLGFLLGGIVGIALIALGMGLAIGYSGYLVALDFGATHIIALVAGVAFFVIGVAFSGRILSLVTAVAGGLLLFEVLTTYGLGSGLSTLIAGALTIAGVWAQFDLGLGSPRRTATSTGGQPSDHS